MVLVSVRKNAKQMFVKPSDGPVSEPDSANVIPTLPACGKERVAVPERLPACGGPRSQRIEGLLWSQGLRRRHV